MFCPEKYCTNCLGVSVLWGTELVDSPNVIFKFLQIIETRIIVPIWPVVQGIFHHSHPTTNFCRPFVVYNTVEPHLVMHCAVTSEFGNPFLREILQCWKWGVGFLWHCFWKSGNSNLILDLVTLKMFFNKPGVCIVFQSKGVIPVILYDIWQFSLFLNSSACCKYLSFSPSAMFKGMEISKSTEGRTEL